VPLLVTPSSDVAGRKRSPGLGCVGLLFVVMGGNAGLARAALGLTASAGISVLALAFLVRARDARGALYCANLLLVAAAIGGACRRGLTRNLRARRARRAALPAPAAPGERDEGHEAPGRPDRR
jgi:hypothetical protein